MFQCENYYSVGRTHTRAHTHTHTNTVQLIQVSFGCRRVKPEATQEEGVEKGPDTATAPLPPRCIANGTGFTCSSAACPAAGKTRYEANTS